MPVAAERKLRELITDGRVDEIISDQSCHLLNDIFQGNKAVIIVNKDDNVPSRITSFGVESKYLEYYSNHFFNLDPMRLVDRPNRVIRMSDVLVKCSYERTEFYNDFFRPMNSYYSLSAHNEVDNNFSVELCVNRSKSATDFSSNDKRRIRLFSKMLFCKMYMTGCYPDTALNDKEALLERVSDLSPRELLLFVHISKGGTVRDFALENGISISSVKDRVKIIHTKLNTHSQRQFSQIFYSITPPGGGDTRQILLGAVNRK